LREEVRKMVKLLLDPETIIPYDIMKLRGISICPFDQKGGKHLRVLTIRGGSAEFLPDGKVRVKVAGEVIPQNCFGALSGGFVLAILDKRHNVVQKNPHPF
jgi:hypothetical protein